MRIAIGADHQGYLLRREIISALKEAGHEVLDMGQDDDTSSDYPDFARAVCEAILAGKADRGILICGSGAGVSIAANKFPGIRAAMAHDTYTAHQGVEHDDMNVICLGSNVVGRWLAADIVKAFLGAEVHGPGAPVPPPAEGPGDRAQGTPGTEGPAAQARVIPRPPQRGRGISVAGPSPIPRWRFLVAAAPLLGMTGPS